MRTVSDTDAKRSFAALLEEAQREPVVIRRNGHDIAVLLSAAAYERLHAVTSEEFQRFCDRIGDNAAAAGLTEAELKDMLADEDGG